MAVGEQPHDRATVVERRSHGLRVNALNVVDLQEGVHRQLPVALELVALDGRRPQAVDIELLELGRNHVQPLEQRLRFRILVDEDPATPLLAANFLEAKAAAIEGLGEVTLVHDGNQPPVRIVRPLMVGAAKPGQLPGRLPHQRRPAVRTDVVKRSDASVSAANEEDGGVGDVQQKKAARLRQLAVVGRIEPDL